MRARYRRLIEEPGTAARAETAAAIAQEFSSGQLSERERQIAADILDAMASDVERQVRWALAEHIKACPFLPAATAQKLAQDVESVALPIIQYSSVLTDRDLMEIVRGGNESKQIAVAQRAEVSSQVSETLVESGRERVVGTLLANHRAEISDAGYARVLALFPKSREIHGLIVKRPYLPITVIVRLTRIVSEELRTYLIEGHGLPREFAESLATSGREKALAESLLGSSDQEILLLVKELHARHALTPMLILRWLCLGDLRFFLAAMAERAEISWISARTLAFEKGQKGFAALFEQADLPADLFTAYRIAAEVIKEGQRDRLGTARKIVERLGQAYDAGYPENLEQTLSQLSQRISEPSTAPIRGVA